MGEEAKKPNLLELVDKKFLQEFQENFSKSTGLASVTIDENGFITEPSNFTDFCMMMKNRDDSSPMCSKCDLEQRKIGFQSTEPFTYTCHAGLTVFVVPIVVNNKTIALMIGGQTLTEKPQEEFYKQLAKECGIEEMECLEKIKKVKILTKEKIESASKLLFQFANSISNTAHKNYELQKMNFREKLLREVAEILRSSLDLNKVKQGITQLIGKAFSADRCYFRAFDKAKGKFLAVDVEYLGSKEVKSLVGVEPNQESLKFFKDEIYKQKKGFYPIVVDENFTKDSPLADYFKQVGIVADYAIPIIDRYDELNWFVLHYAKKDPKLSEEDKRLLESIAYQIATAFEQIKMYEKEKQTALKLTAILDNIPYWTWIKDNEGKYIVVNKQYAKDQNLTIDSFIGKTDFDIYPTKIAQAYVNDDKEVMETKEEKTIEVEDTIINGEKKSLETYKSPLLNDIGEVIGTVGIAKDITERKEAQAELLLRQEKILESVQREALLRKITEKIRSSLNIDSTLGFICEETAKFLNVQRSSIIVFPEKNNYMKFELKKEYKESDSLNGYLKIANIEHVAEYWGKMLIKNKIHAIDNIPESDAPDYFKNSYNAMGVKSIVGTIIGDKNDIWGDLILSEYNKIRHWSTEEKEFLKTISQQIYIAVNQAELYSKTLEQREREKAILTNLPFLVWLKDKESRFLAVNEPFAQMCGFKVDDLVGKTDYDIWPKELADGYVHDDKEVMQKRATKSTEELIQDDEKRRWHETYKTPIYNDKGEVIGTTGFARDITESKEAQEKIIKAAEKETLLRKTMEILRSTFDFEKIKNSFVEIIKDYYNPDRCIVEDYVPESDIILPFRIEHIKSQDMKKLENVDVEKSVPEFVRKVKKGKCIIIRDVEKTYKRKNFNGYKSLETLHEDGVKSDYGIPIVYKGQFYGTLILHYIAQKKKFSHDEFAFLKLLVEQAGIAFYQAELFEKEKLSAEREKMSRNIIEILRSSIDKSIIKKLFVKNLGKFFNADRVFLSEYDIKTNTLMPIDASSEYLSSADEKTSTNYDFTSPEFSQHVDTLLEKREIRVEDFEEFIKQNPGLDEKLIELYREANAKSSYAFPIIYQDHIMGAFAIQFTHQVVKLSTEDLSRIRSICTQAGIALYHANLYEKAKECEASKQAFMMKVSEQIEQPVHEILDISTLLSQNEFEHFIEVEYLNKIIGSCNNLLKLTAKIDES